VTAAASQGPGSARACPLCGGPNACVPATSGSFGQPCWCESATFSPTLLERVPAGLRGLACICARCAGIEPAASSTQPPASGRDPQNGGRREPPQDRTGGLVIVAYKPKPGKEQRLDAVVAKHLRVLASERLITNRPASVMRADDGTNVEVFEWLSAEAIGAAHGNPAIFALWGEFAAVCDFVRLADVPEAQRMFAEYEPVSPLGAAASLQTPDRSA
jgi:hypothetical protein